MQKPEQQNYWTNLTKKIKFNWDKYSVLHLGSNIQQSKPKENDKTLQATVVEKNQE